MFPLDSQRRLRSRLTGERSILNTADHAFGGEFKVSGRLILCKCVFVCVPAEEFLPINKVPAIKSSSRRGWVVYSWPEQQFVK